MRIPPHGRTQPRLFKLFATLLVALDQQTCSLNLFFGTCHLHMRYLFTNQLKLFTWSIESRKWDNGLRARNRESEPCTTIWTHTHTSWKIGIHWTNWYLVAMLQRINRSCEAPTSSRFFFWWIVSLSNIRFDPHAILWYAHRLKLLRLTRACNENGSNHLEA